MCTVSFPITHLICHPQLTSFIPFLQSWSSASPGTFTIISGVLPPAVSAFFGFFLPIVMRWLSQYQGALTQSRLDRAVVARYYAFLVISQLVIFTLIGVMFSGSSQNLYRCRITLMTVLKTALKRSLIRSDNIRISMKF